GTLQASPALPCPTLPPCCPAPCRPPARPTPGPRPASRPARRPEFFAPGVRATSPAAHTLEMKALDILKHWPVDIVSDTPAARAFNAKLVTRADLLRLKVIARLHARGLPPDVGWSDLLQEAFARVLDGSRSPPEAVPFVAFLSGVMRSIKEQHWRRARKGARQNSKLLAELDAEPAGDGELPDPAPDPQRSAIAIQEMDAINQL